VVFRTPFSLPVNPLAPHCPQAAFLSWQRGARAVPGGPTPGKWGNPPKMFSPAGKAPARNCRKFPQIGLMIAKTLFLM
jgi:hypothetical protein